ncbi:Oxoglutarate/iron-dependent dioxygenase [Trema orientale]|uniref:Oxoglutarate/iron-dependent dioxygenase n=1 Tax=Trema orientale TaxID=63057 RepID=A0A2P5FU62_TREOI|nr:Oxoglutarate/iron-dependent dioxygenase [Trema orientale]
MDSCTSEGTFRAPTIAGLVLPVEAVSQEIAIDGENPPQQFFVKDSTAFGSMDDSPPRIPIPVIDLSLLSSESELEKLRSALSSWGCFQAIGHGISISFLDKVREMGEEFFSLPMEEKQKCSRAASDREGFGSDVVVSKEQVLDWCNRLSLRVFPEDGRRLNLWPENPNDFGETLMEYSKKIRSVMEVVLEAIARSLGLEEDVFLKHFGDKAMMQARFNFYPPCPRTDKVLGIKPHSDKSGLTVLLQDKEVEGLQVFKDNQWSRVPTIPHALLINLGDQMEIMTNGVMKSPLHRVTTNAEKLRISIAMLIEPDPEAEIGPVDGLVDEERPKMYKTVKNFGRFNYVCFQNGLVALDAIKI